MSTWMRRVVYGECTHFTNIGQSLSGGLRRTLNEYERAELGGVEYRALDALLWLLLAYNIFWLMTGTVILVPYSYRASVVNVLRSSQPGALNPGWFGFFAVVTSFANGGLNVVNANFIPFHSYYLILSVCGALTVAGNTQFPIFLRLLIWVFSKVSPRKSRFRQTLVFLLHHPRRCFIYLFPSKETWYLLAIQLVIDLTMWIFFEILNLGLPAVMAIPLNVRIYDGLFQATGLRTSGAYIINMSYLAPALLVAYLVAMYISSFPIVMALRQTNNYEERSIGLDKDQPGGGGLAAHLRQQLAYDIWFQILAWFLICIIERGKVVSEQPGFSAFNILFEVSSAYGTVGLSTGVPYDNYSLSGAFQTGSKIIMLAVMIRGRHRGLPLAIDRSILLPGEDLMHKMDQEYNEYSELDSGDESEVRRDEELSGKQDSAGGIGAKQDPEREDDEDHENADLENDNEGSRQGTKGKNRAEVQLSG
jgi:potassium uptake Trk family protein